MKKIILIITSLVLLSVIILLTSTILKYNQYNNINEKIKIIEEIDNKTENLNETYIDSNEKYKQIDTNKIEELEKWKNKLEKMKENL